MRETLIEPAELAAPPGGRRFRGAPRASMIIIATLLAMAGFASIVRVPYHSVGPGPSTDVLALVKVTGADTHPTSGKLLLTTATVSGQPLNLWELLYVWVRPDLGVTPRGSYIRPGYTDNEQDAENAYAMEQSKIDAEIAAFEVLGKAVTKIRGARVISVVAGAPADGKLRPGDTILAIDGKEVRDPEGTGTEIRARDVGDEVTLTVRRDGRRRDVTVKTRPSSSDARSPSVGVFLGNAYRLPANIQIDTQQIGGPSGGLVFALAIVDVLTPGDLTAGHTVAATGTISRDENGVARVGVIGAIAEKVHAADSAGADIFLVPAQDEEEARAVAPEGMQVIGVATLADALRALEALAAAEGG